MQAAALKIRNRAPSADRPWQCQFWSKTGKCCCADRPAIESLHHTRRDRPRCRYRQTPEEGKNKTKTKVSKWWWCMQVVTQQRHHKMRNEAVCLCVSDVPFCMLSQFSFYRNCRRCPARWSASCDRYVAESECGLGRLGLLFHHYETHRRTGLRETKER